jgi:hypothetical protein
MAFGNCMDAKLELQHRVCEGYYPADMGYVVGFAISFAPTALALLASYQLSKRSVEEWQLLAWVPPLPLVGFWIWLLVGMVRNPTGNNLWPFAMVFFILITAALFVLFLVARKFLGSAVPPRWRR